MQKEEGYGLVLSGGGTKGAYEVGAWKALRELRIPIRGIVGTSIGALNAALFFQKDPDLPETLYTSLQAEDILEFGESVDPSKNLLGITNLRGIAFEFLKQGGFSNALLKGNIEKYIDMNAIYRSPRDFGVMTFSIDDLTPLAVFKEDVSPADMVNYLAASANFPFFKPEEMEGQRLLDGALYDNVPINMLIARGYQKILVIDISGMGMTRKALANKDVYIKKIRCSEPLGGTFEFDPERISRNIQLGYLDTLKAFQKLQGHHFYFDIRYFNKLLENFNLDEIYGLESAARLYGLDRFQIIKDDRFLEELLTTHLKTKVIYQTIGEKGFVSHLARRPSQIMKMIDSGMGIVWIEELIRSWPAQDWMWFKRFIQDYVLAANAMIALTHYFQE
mgnify:CR=1 FL=1|jgi:NTE family protein